MSFIAQEVVDQLHHSKVFTAEVLAELLHCSLRTAWRRLHDLNACTSYNHNAKYHTLPDIARFDEFGIWRYGDIGFSRYGNLTRTVVHLVDSAPEGISAQQLCAVLGIVPSSVYTFLRGIAAVSPQRVGRSLVFFSAKTQTRTLQVVRHSESSSPLRSGDAVLVLVDRIKHPDDTIEQCVRRLRSHSASITPEAVRLLLQRHGIVKKTAHKL